MTIGAVTQGLQEGLAPSGGLGSIWIHPQTARSASPEEALGRLLNKRPDLRPRLEGGVPLLMTPLVPVGKLLWVSGELAVPA